jgi:hypothetical protein
VSSSSRQSADIRIYDLISGKLLCAKTAENTSNLAFTSGRTGNWFNDHSLLYNNLVVFHLDVPTRTLMEIARFD